MPACTSPAGRAARGSRCACATWPRSWPGERGRAAAGPVAYPDADEPLRERTREALADPELAGNLRAAAASWAAGRERMVREKGFAEMRARAREIRRGNIRDLPALLDRLEERVTAAGGVVARVGDAEAACRYITDLAAERGARLVAKSKSMATEEIKLNEALEEAGLRVVETDLGEWIIQLAGQHPSHIVAPAVHLNKDQVRELFAAESGEDAARRARGAGGPRPPAPARGLRGRRHRGVGRELRRRRDRHASAWSRTRATAAW